MKRKRQKILLPATTNRGKGSIINQRGFCFFPCVSPFLAPACLARSQQLARGAHAAPAVSVSVFVSLSVVRGATFKLPVGRYPRYPCFVWVWAAVVRVLCSVRRHVKRVPYNGRSGESTVYFSLQIVSICIRARLARTLKKISACSLGGRASGHKLEKNLSAPSVDTVLFHWWPFCISWQDIGVLRKRVNTVWTLHSNTSIFVDAIGRSHVVYSCCCGPDL